MVLTKPCLSRVAHKGTETPVSSNHSATVTQDKERKGKGMNHWHCEAACCYEELIGLCILHEKRLTIIYYFKHRTKVFFQSGCK